MCRMSRIAGLSLLSTMLSLTIACSGRQDSQQTGGGRSGGTGRPNDLRSLPGTRFSVTYTDRTVLVDREEFRKALKSVSRSRRVFVFDKSAEPFSRLKAGNILFIRNLAIRKVLAVATEGEYVYVGTGPASLTEVIRNGDMHWEAPVRFLEAYRSRMSATGLGRGAWFALADRLAGWSTVLERSVWADSGNQEGQKNETGDTKKEEQKEGGWEITGTLTGWDYTIHSVPAPDRLNFDLQLSRRKAMTAVNVSASGYLQNFETSTTVLVQDSVMKYFDYRNKDINGEANFTWSAVKTEAGKEDPLESEAKLKLPTSFSIPLMLGEFPFALEISEALIIAPVFSQEGDAANGTFRVTYAGTQGFTVQGGKASFEGKTDGNAAVAKYGAISRTIPGTCLVAVAFPKIELKPSFESLLEKVEEAVPSSLGDRALEYLKENVKEDFKESLKTGAAAFFSLGISTSALSSGIASPVPCQGAHLVVSAKVGAEANVLGVNLLSIENEVFSRKIHTAVPAVKGCLGQ